MVGTLFASGCAWFSDPPKDSTHTAPARGASSTTGADGVVNNASGQAIYVVKADFTPLFRTGPAQPTGPDSSLPKNTVVAVLKKGFGYTRVQVGGGLDGYVATEDLAPATAAQAKPPEPVMDANTENNSAIVEHYSVDKARSSAATSTSNAEALPELPEPRLEPEASPSPKPEFRY